MDLHVLRFLGVFLRGYGNGLWYLTVLISVADDNRVRVIDAFDPKATRRIRTIGDRLVETEALPKLEGAKLESLRI